MRFLIGWLMVLWLPLSASALSGKGTTAAAFLKIGVGPRAVAMGETFAAVADEVSAVYWNPAGLSQLERPEVTAMHTFWLQDVFFDYVAGALPLGDLGTAGASLVYLNGGSMPRTQVGDTLDDPERGLFTASDIGFTAAYGYAFTPALRLGAGLKLFSETVDARASFGWAWDLAFLYRSPWPTLTMAAVVQNLGPAASLKDDYFRLPINFKIGFSYRPLDRLLLALDYNQLLEQYGKIALGAEYLFEKNLALRLGYQYQEKIDPAEVYSGYGANGLSGFNLGLGVRYLDFRLDYAFVPYGFLGSAHRIALTYVFPLTAAAPRDNP